MRDAWHASLGACISVGCSILLSVGTHGLPLTARSVWSYGQSVLKLASLLASAVYSMQITLVCRCGSSSQDVEQRVDAMRGPTVADLLSTGVRERAAPHALIELLRRLDTCPRSQQQLLYDAQGSEVLVSLLQHKEPSVQLEACLALTCIQEPSIQLQCINAGPLVAALSGMLHAKQSANRSRSTKIGGKPAISTKSTSQQSTPASAATWVDIPRLAAAAFCSCADPGALEEVCCVRPDLLSTLPQLLVDTVEGALHEQVAQQQALGPHQQLQQPWQLPAASAAMEGLLQLLCGSCQQVHCAVVRHLCRLAYCTCVLEQLGVGLAAYPGAVAAVAAMVRAWDREDFAANASADTCPTTTTVTSTTIAMSPLTTAGRSSLHACHVKGEDNSNDNISPSKSTSSTGTLTTTSIGSSSTSSLHWPGGVPQLQAEAAAALLVLSSLGSGAMELATREEATVIGLLLAQFERSPWQEQPQQQKPLGVPVPIPQQAMQLLWGLLRVLLQCIMMPLVFVLHLPGECGLYGTRTVLRTRVAQWNDRLQTGVAGIKAWWADFTVHGAVGRAWPWCLIAACLWWGWCYEQLAWSAFLAMMVADFLPRVGGRVFTIVQGLWQLPVSSEQWLQLRQRWAVYCLWHLCLDGCIYRSIKQENAHIARRVLQRLQLEGPVHFVLGQKGQSGLVDRSRLPEAEQRCAFEPPLLPHLLATWRCRLNTHALEVGKEAWAELGLSVRPLAMLLLLAPSCAWVLQVLAMLPYLKGLRHLSSLSWYLPAYGVFTTVVLAITNSMKMLLGAFVGVVVTASSHWPGSYQVVVATRPAPAAAPPRTWLQPVTYLSLDLSPDLTLEASRGSLGRYAQFGGWPPACRFRPTPCTTQHAAEARVEWLLLLLKLVWSHVGLSLLAGALYRVVSTTWAVQLLSAAAGSNFLLQWVWAAWAASLKLCCVAIIVSTALVQLCCVAVQPSYFLPRWCARMYWRCVKLAGATPWRLTRCMAAAGRGAINRAASPMLSLPRMAWLGTRVCVLAEGRCVASAATAAMRLGAWSAALPGRLLAVPISVLAGRLRRQPPIKGHAVRQQQQQQQQQQHHQQQLAGPGPSHMPAAAVCTTGGTGGGSSRPGVTSNTGGRGKGRRHRSQRVAVVCAAQEGQADAACATSSAAIATGSVLDALRSPHNAPAASSGGRPHTSQSVVGAQGGASMRTPRQAAAPTAAQVPLEAAASTRRQLHTGAASQTPGTASSDVRPVTTVQPVANPSISIMSTAPPEAAPDATTSHATVTAPQGAVQQQQQQQQEAALAAGEQVAHAAAKVAAAAASAAGHPLEEVHLAAARAAAEALQATAALPLVEASMLVVQAANAAAGLYTARRTTLAASAAAAVAATPPLAATTAARDTGTMADAGPPLAAAAPAAPRRPKKAKVRVECVVCLDARPSVTTHPCGHRVLCGRCAQLVAASKGECPMCRAAVVRYEAGPGRV